MLAEELDRTAKGGVPTALESLLVEPVGVVPAVAEDGDFPHENGPSIAGGRGKPPSSDDESLLLFSFRGSSVGQVVGHGAGTRYLGGGAADDTAS